MLRRSRLLGTASLLAGLGASVLVPAQARADSCTITGAPWTHKVMKLDAFGGSASVEWRQFNPIAVPFENDTNYASTFGVFITEGSGPSIWAVELLGENAPRVVVGVNGQSYPNEPVPVPGFRFLTGVHGSYNSFGFPLGTGTYYVVAYGTGPVTGALGDGYWTVDVEGGTCTPVQKTAEIYTYNETNFSPADRFSSHVHTPLFGAGSHLRLTHPVTRTDVFGSVFSSNDGGTSDLRWRREFGTGGHVGKKYNEAIDLLDSGGPVKLIFDLDYYGANALNNISFIEIDIP